MSHLFRRSWRALAIASLLVSWTAPGAKAQSPLDFIPEDAAVVARVKSPDSIINTAKSWIPSPLQEQLLPAITELIGACGKSQDSAAECWVIEFGQSGNKSWAYVIQTSNATEKKSTYADAAMSTSLGKCQIFAGTEANGARLIDCRAGKVKSLAATMDPKARELFEKEAVSVYINARQLSYAVWKRSRPTQSLDFRNGPELLSAGRASQTEKARCSSRAREGGAGSTRQSDLDCHQGSQGI